MATDRTHKVPIKNILKRVQFKNSNKVTALVSRHSRLTMFMTVFAVLGIFTLLLSQAASFSIGIEAENGSISGGVTTPSDAGASGGRFVLFGSSGGNNGTCADGPAFSSANICINPQSIQRAATGFNVQNDAPDQYRPGIAHPEMRAFAAFRTECQYASTSRNDPIVYPGQANAAHWHVFFGNTAADHNLTNPINQGNSTCTGGTHNKTAYWAPALVETNSYNPSTKQFNLAQTMPQDPMQDYYKSSYAGVQSDEVSPFPTGLRMIAGSNPNSRPTSSMSTDYLYFDCINSGSAQDVYNGMYYLTSIPTNCPPGKFIQATIVFPQCGARNPDGSPVIDSPDHRSHMAYPIKGSGCPPTHPINYAEIIEHFRWVVPSTGSAGLRFSSDMYPGVAAGWTFHADWFNGWNPTTFNTLLNNCYKISRSQYGGGSGFGLDCGMNLFRPVTPGNYLGPWQGFRYIYPVN